MKTKFKETEIGMIPENWKTGIFKEILVNDIRHGVYKSKEFLGKGVKLLKMGIQYSNNKIGNQEMERADLTLDEINRFRLNEDDLVFSRTSMMTDGAGKCSIVIKLNEPIVFDGNLISATIDKKKALPNFYFYYFNSGFAKQKISEITTGTQSRNISASNLMKLPIIIPPLLEQENISKILSDLDSKIELNQQMNKTLEELGQVIFKHWFVDFEFPNEQGKPYKSSGGEMVYNEELGKEIPSNSRVINLGELIELDKGLSYKGAFLTNNENGLPMVNLGTFRPLGGFNDDKMKYYSGEFKERHLVKSGDLVIANTDITQNRVILGSPSLIPSYLNSQKILFTHHVYAVRNKNNLIKNEFLYYVLQSSEYRNRAKGFATGTTVLALPRDAILELPIILFDESILNNFDKLITNIIKKIETNYLQILNLSKTRDSLLPKLMSGKIRVPVETN